MLLTKSFRLEAEVDVRDALVGLEYADDASVINIEWRDDAFNRLFLKGPQNGPVP